MAYQHFEGQKIHKFRQNKINTRGSTEFRSEGVDLR